MKINLSEKAKKRLTRKQKLLEKHLNGYMLGQTLSYLDNTKNTIDVGARNGLYSSYFVNHSKHVYSFEAVEPVFNSLKELELENNNFTAYNLAVSNFNGTSDFYVDLRRLSNSSFTNHVNGQLIQVKTVTLDSMDFDNVGFLKIDVEGFELNVLKGASTLLETYQPTCMIEIFPKFNNGSVDYTFDFMFDRGYTCFYNIKNQGLKKIVDTSHGVEIAHSDVEIHDGDFLFVKHRT